MKPVQSTQVVVTRPVGAAGALPRRLSAAGFTPVLLPSLTLAVAPDADLVRDRLAALRDCHAVIAVSASAVRFALRIAPQLRLPAAVRGYAVGAGSARALRSICAGPVEWPPQATSEDLLRLASLSNVRGRRVAILAAPGGRTVMAETLRERGAEVEVIHVYRRHPARWDRRHRQRLQQLDRPWVLLTSAEALNKLLLLAGPEKVRLLRGCAVVSSARLQQIAQEAGFARVQRASGPADDALLACISGAGDALRPDKDR